ncbi:MAG: hypothetical protein K0R83_754 [Caulobacter sp.]|jgi:hypothetical protein|nr:hypothetical protein [Caulobacter sp.]
MGAWSHEPFGNDDALDFLAELEHRGMQAVGGLLQEVIDLDYVEADMASAGVAAAAVLAAVHSKDASLLPEDHRHLVARLSGGEQGLVGLGRAALDRIGADSELMELWSDAPEFEAWQASLAGIRERLA